MDVPKKISSWRDYQRKLQRAQKNDRRKRFILENSKFVLPIIIGCLIVYGAICGSFGSLFDDTKKAQAPISVQKQVKSQKTAPAASFKKDQIHQFLDSGYFADLQDNVFEVQNNGRHLRVQTSIDPALQNYLTQKQDSKN